MTSRSIRWPCEIWICFPDCSHGQAVFKPREAAWKMGTAQPMQSSAAADTGNISALLLQLRPLCSHQQPADAAALINGTIRDGIQYFRARLRRCGHMIMVEVQALEVDDSTLKPITALLSDGPSDFPEPANHQALEQDHRQIPE